MSYYTPDQWILVKISGDNPHYRVFGSWGGSYLDGPSWRMNSGITGVTDYHDYFIFSGNSGSAYHCHKNAYGISNSYNYVTLLDYEEKSNGQLEILHEMPDIMNIKW